MNISSPYTTYTPGSGYAAYYPGYDKPVCRWGAEFDEQMKEKAEQYAASNVETPVSPNGPGIYDPQKLESFDRRELSGQELRALAAKFSEKYDPGNMTQEEYDSFLDDLVEEGLLSKNELGTLGYHGLIVLGSLPEGINRILWSSVDTKNPDWNTYFSRYGYAVSLQDTRGDALAYAKLMSLRKPISGSADWRAFADTQHSAYTIMANVLEAIQNERK